MSVFYVFLNCTYGTKSGKASQFYRSYKYDGTVTFRDVALLIFDK